ncbi:MULTISPECIES: mannuronan 5-epimerase AlgG [Pseudomonas]|uniref:mannuronan 5-epimerase n=2 Tax=Pseudomonas extremorientalis TaxID=169669 RepID=A0A1S2TPB2_9PSED|nr:MULTISPECIES: mannuronan 5-epimerase AlgG [Pseudomonas]KAB0521320.1 right-handed parallel beta-helix repeat-containing protein [Pseudomonas extremorientalis]OIN11255.1 poly(beta-D-mannuronate) C5 epimerase [Pseudomonas extremorientalis]PMV26509.1 right-handed parallel beta-helix repeat-containing protein [Pseudomonas sp. FW305-3-2-15-C-TSA2]PMV31880.1 right-handed parallel beta-helix repeat-containing protein [Pseudomonas sp. DP16D-L5]PMV41323.1 right-handed parallel beta-helix repeat-conta
MGARPMNAQSLLVAAMLLASATAFADTAAKAPTIAKELQQAKTYTISSPPTAPLEMAKPALPDLSGYTAAAMEKKIVRTKPGKISIRRMMQEDALKDFIGGDNKMAEWVVRQHGIPQAIFVDDGYMNLKDLLGKVPKQYLSETSPGVFLAKLPIVVGRKGILEIDKKTQELRLSQEGGSFLINDGQLFVHDTKVTGWSEKANGPALFKSPKEFRPFLLAWGGTETYISNTKMASFGYANSKSYGVSISQYTPNMAKVLKRPEPTGWIIDSEFSDMWYGFYCYETTGFVIKGNTYKDNIVYGIDPHDRSHGLIIADNTVYGTKKKHGIIISREVNDSFIFNNRSYDNKLSGLVIDRNSVNNLIADNEIYRNHTDGITLYESGDNLLWGNKVISNRRHGIRVRNSVNIKLYENTAMANGLTGVYGHIKDLTDTDRDIALDPFDAKVSLIVVGGELAGNGSGPLSIDSPLSIELYRVSMLAPTKSSGISFSGVLGDRQEEILDLLVRQQKAVLIDPVERQTEMQD